MKVVREVTLVSRARAGALAVTALVPYALVAVCSGLLFERLSLSPVTFALVVLANTLYQGLAVEVIAVDRQGGQRSMAEMTRGVVPALPKLMGVGAIAGLLIGCGLLLVLVPGFWLMTIWAVVGPVVLIERLAPSTAFERSRKMIKGYGWPVFGLVFGVFFLCISTCLVLTTLGMAIYGSVVVFMISLTFALVLTGPIQALIAAALYFELVALETYEDDLLKNE